MGRDDKAIGRQNTIVAAKLGDGGLGAWSSTYYWKRFSRICFLASAAFTVVFPMILFLIMCFQWIYIW